MQKKNCKQKMLLLRKVEKLIVSNSRQISKLEKRVILQNEEKFDGK